MGPSRVVEALLLHLEEEMPELMATSPPPRPSALQPSKQGGGGGASHQMVNGNPAQQPYGAGTGSNNPGALTPSKQLSSFLPKSDPATYSYPSITSSNPNTSQISRTIKPLLQTRVDSIPPAVGPGEGVELRLAEPSDDIRVSRRGCCVRRSVLGVGVDVACHRLAPSSVRP